MLHLLALLLLFAPAQRWSDTLEEVKAARELVAKSKAPGLRWTERDHLRKEAVTIYDGVLDARPDHPTAHLARARLLVDLGRLNEAAAAFRHCVAATPYSEQCVAELGEMYIDQGYIDLAIEVLDGRGGIADIELARAKLVKRDVKAAVALLDDAPHGLPDEPFFSGYALALLHHRRDAIGILELVLEDEDARPGVKASATKLIERLKGVI